MPGPYPQDFQLLQAVEQQAGGGGAFNARQRVACREDEALALIDVDVGAAGVDGGRRIAVHGLDLEVGQPNGAFVPAVALPQLLEPNDTCSSA